MAGMLRRNCAPAEIMAQVAAFDRQLQQRFATTGRSDPCPCGSGKKFKQC